MESHYKSENWNESLNQWNVAFRNRLGDISRHFCWSLLFLWGLFTFEMNDIGPSVINEFGKFLRYFVELFVHYRFQNELNHLDMTCKHFENIWKSIWFPISKFSNQKLVPQLRWKVIMFATRIANWWISILDVADIHCCLLSARHMTYCFRFLFTRSTR